MIEGLRNRQANWPRYRWWALAGGVVYIAAAFWGIALINSIDQDTAEIKILMYAVCSPWALFMIAKGTHMLATTIRDWHGNVYDSLILRLIERSEADQPHKWRK